MALLVTYTFSLDRGISIKLKIGLRVGIVSIFGEDPEQRHCLSPRSVALGNDFLVALISSSCATWILAVELSDLNSIGLPLFSPKPSFREFVSATAVGCSGPYLPSRNVVLKAAVFLAQFLTDALHSRQPFPSRIQLLNCLFFHKERPLQVFDLYLQLMLLLFQDRLPRFNRA